MFIRAKPIISSERILLKDYDRNGSVAKNSDREARGAWRQDEQIGAKPPAIKQL
jgi:hypothetical protein